MSKEVEYRGYAERTRSIAGQLEASERAELLKIAEEWDSLASDFERRRARANLRMQLPKPTLRLRFRPLHLVGPIIVALTSGLLVSAGWMKHLRASRSKGRDAPPTKTAVYRYRIWARDLSKYSIPEHMATREFIQRAGGEIYEKSRKLVEESNVTPEGEEIVDQN